MTEEYIKKRIHVAVGVIAGKDGRILVARRTKDQHLGGLWEFPGGKLEDGETVVTALHRELREELAIEVRAQTPLIRIEHDYPEKSVLLDVWTVSQFDGTPVSQEGQPLRWLSPDELTPVEFPEANRAIIRRLQLPDHIAIYQAGAKPTDFSAFATALPPLTLLRLRRYQNGSHRQSQYNPLITDALKSCEHTGTGLIVDLDKPALTDSGLDWLINSGEPAIKGCHANSQILEQLTSRPVPDHLLFGVSCHTAAGLHKAKQAGADYALLSPVLATASHPGVSLLGWDGLARLLEDCDLPVYAMGGMRLADMDMAKAAGARGIAGISTFRVDAGVSLNCDRMR
jgi:8-oxo-dGTP diphosphatase